MKDLNETMRTQHNQAEEVIEWVSEDLAQAKLIKHGVDRVLMQAMKMVTDMLAQLERAQSEHKALWDAVRPLALLFHRPKDSDKRLIDIMKEILAALRAMCMESPRSASRMYSELFEYYIR